MYKEDEAPRAPPPRLEDFAQHFGYKMEGTEAARTIDRAEEHAREEASAAATESAEVSRAAPPPPRPR